MSLATRATTILLVVGLLTEPVARADSAANAAVVVVAATGATVAVGAGVYAGVLSYNAPDWVNPKTDSTSHLDRQCEMNIEVRVLSTHRMNGLFIGLANTTSRSRVLKPEEVLVRFESGRERLANFPMATNNIELKPAWRLFGIIPLPEKYDFKDQRSIEIEVPIYEGGQEPVCTIKTKIKRSPGSHDDPRTYTNYTVVDFDFEFGGSIARTSNLANVGSQGFDFDLSLYVYPTINHGFFLDLGVLNFGQGSLAAQAAAVQAGGSASSSFTALTYGAGYSYRQYFSENWSWNADVSVNGADFRYSSSGGNTDLGTLLAFKERLALDYRFAHVDYGYWAGDYSLGATLANLWIPGGNLTGVPASGADFQAMLRLKIGF